MMFEGGQASRRIELRDCGYADDKMERLSYKLARNNNLLYQSLMWCDKRINDQDSNSFEGLGLAEKKR